MKAAMKVDQLVQCVTGPQQLVHSCWLCADYLMTPGTSSNAQLVHSQSADPFAELLFLVEVFVASFFVVFGWVMGSLVCPGSGFGCGMLCGGFVVCVTCSHACV